MSSEELANHLTSGLLAPTVGAVLVLLAWLLAAYQEGVPLRDQALAALLDARKPLVAALSAGGGTLAATNDPGAALAVALTSLLALTNFRLPKP